MEMKLRGTLNKLHVVILMVLLLTANCCCCSPQPPQRGEELVEWISRGFEKPPSRLFISDGRLAQLVAYLGYDPVKYSIDCDRSTDGTSVRCWNRGRTSAVLIAMAQPARVLSTPAGAFLDDHNDVVAWYGENAGDHKITFRGGKAIFAPNFQLDSTGSYFCYGGIYFDYEANASRTAPVQLASVEDPGRPIVTCQLHGTPAGLYVTASVVLVVSRSRTGQMPNVLVCEEYARDNSGLVFRRQFELRSPAKLGCVNFVPEDFDPLSLSLLVKVSRDMPLGSNIWYVYGVKTGWFRKVGVFEGYAGFIDRHIFDESLEEVHHGQSQQN